MEEETENTQNVVESNDTTNTTTETTNETGTGNGQNQQNAQLTETTENTSENGAGGNENNDNAETTETENEDGANAEPNTYTSVEGDTLALIAERLFGDRTQVNVLQDLNPDLADPNNITVGTCINIPTDEQIAQFREAKALESKQNEPPPPVEVKDSTVPEDTTPVETPIVEGGLNPTGGEGGTEEIPVEEPVLEEVPPVVEETPVVQGTGEVPAVPEQQVYPVTDTTSLQDNTIVEPVPTVTTQSETVTTAAAQTATQNPPTTSPEPTAGETITKNLHDAFFGPWSAVLTPLGLGGRGQARAAELGGNISKAWNKIGGGDNAAAHIRDVLDLVYTVCDGVTGFTGPLGQILGIASYIRYIPFPATIAIGNWMKVVSEFLNTLTFILDVVKVVTGALKTVFGVIAVHNTRDPKLRQEYRDALKSDVGNLIADGFSVGFTVATGGHKNSFTDGWTNAAKGSGLRGAFQATHAAVRSDTLSNIVGIGLHSAVNRAPYFTSALTNIATQEAKNIGTYGTIFNEAVVKPFIAPGLTGLMLPSANTNQAGTGTGAGAGTTPAPVQQLAVQRSAGASAAPATLSTAAPAAIGGRGAALRALQQASRAALMQAGMNTTTPVTDNPLPPAQVTRSPLQMAPLAEEKSVLKGTEEDLLAQKKVAEAGIAENAAWSKGADEHLEGLKGEKAAVEGVAAKTQEDKAEIAEGKAKTAEGKAQSQKGSSKASEAENGPGGAPGDASTDVPWYKKPFLWIIRKLNQAKSAVMDAITKAIMKALENVLNFDNLDEQLAATDTALGEQEAVVNAEPAELGAMSAQLGTEETKTMQAKGEAEQRKAQNEEIKAKAEADYQAVKAQREAVEAEEQATKTDKDAYDATYAPTVEEMKDLAAKQQQGEVAPLRLQMDQRRAILEEMLNTLANGLSGHRANASGLVQRLRAEASGHVSGAFGDQPDQKGQALGQIDLVQVTVEGSLTTGIGTREAALAELRGRVAAVAAGEPTTAMLQQLNDLEGEIVSFADAIDATEAQELDAIHTSFSETYSSLVGGLAAA